MCSLINVEYRIIVILFSIVGLTYMKPYHRYRRHAWAHSTNVDVRCFSGDSFVKLLNGQTKRIDLLVIGDEILTIDQARLVPTQFIMMLDKHMSNEALFYTLQTSCGNELSLTEYHLIPILSLNDSLVYKFAKQIQQGDLLYAVFNDQVTFCPVVSIRIERKKGYYAPLTIKGTLLVNQILVSSFAHVNKHDLAQFYMFPLRFYYHFTRLFSFTDPLYIYKSEGLNWFIEIIFYFARCFTKDTLVF